MDTKKVADELYAKYAKVVLNTYGYPNSGLSSFDRIQVKESAILCVDEILDTLTKNYISGGDCHSWEKQRNHKEGWMEVKEHLNNM